MTAPGRSLVRHTIAASVGAAACLGALPNGAAAGDALVYFGTYTTPRSGSEGIYVARLDGATGRLSPPELAAPVTNPSFVAIHPDGRFLYAVSEVAESGGQPGGAVTAFAIDAATGRLTELNARNSGGGGPCHLTLDPSGRTLLVANYGGGSCAAFPIDDDGSLKPAASVIQHRGSSVNPTRQKGPHAHSANPTPDGRFAVVADLGTDRLQLYALDPATSVLTPHGETAVAPGSGPRHFAFHPGGKHAWVINELTLTVTGFRYDANKGTLEEIQTLGTIPEEDRGRTGQSTAEIQAHPGGHFVYGSNRGHDSIAVFRVDPATGTLGLVEVAPALVKTPRNFGIDPSGRFLLAAGQASNTVRVFAIDPDTGKLKDTGHQVDVGAPVCVKFLALP